MVKNSKNQSKVEKVHNKNGKINSYMFVCPACNIVHSVGTSWKFNGDMCNPTFSPSLLVRYTKSLTQEQYERAMAGEDVSLELVKMVCHSFIEEGKIKFLNDCTHHLKGQTVELLSTEDS